MAGASGVVHRKLSLAPILGIDQRAFLKGCVQLVRIPLGAHLP